MKLLLFVAVLIATSSASADTAAPAEVHSDVLRPAIVPSHAWGSKPQSIPDSRKQVPRFVTIHHAGVRLEAKDAPEQFLRDMQSAGQTRRGWPDLPYHFLISSDGTIYEGRPLDYEPESKTSYPLAGNIGIELMGNFDVQRPDLRQVAACVKLTAWLCERFGIDSTLIRGHSDVAAGQTTCPGKAVEIYLNNGLFRRWVNEARAGRTPVIELAPEEPAADRDPGGRE